MAMSTGPNEYTQLRYRHGRTGKTAGVAPQRDLKLKPNQLVWLVAIIVVGVIVGIALGLWWGLAAAAVTLATSEATERISRSRRSSSCSLDIEQNRFGCDDAGSMTASTIAVGAASTVWEIHHVPTVEPDARHARVLSDPTWTSMRSSPRINTSGSVSNS